MTRSSTSFRPRPVLLLVALIVAGVLAVGCGGDDESSEPGQALDSVSIESLNGKTYVSTAVKGRELVDGTNITMSFGPDAITASAGCNSIRGAIEVSDGMFSMGKSAGTLLGCPEDLQAQDEWLTSVLTTGLRAYEDSGNLLLLGLGVEITMEEGTVPGGPPPIVGTTWELNGYESGNGTVQSVKQGVRYPFIRFTENDAFEIFDGCNEGGGKVSVNDDGSMDFGPMRLTRKACPGLSGTVSRAMGDVLGGKAFYAFEGQNLVISRKGSSLTFAPG